MSLMGCSLSFCSSSIIRYSLCADGTGCGPAPPMLGTLLGVRGLGDASGLPLKGEWLLLSALIALALNSAALLYKCVFSVSEKRLFFCSRSSIICFNYVFSSVSLFTISFQVVTSLYKSSFS